MDYKHDLVFECEKDKLEINSRSDFKLIDIQGIEASSYTINTKASNQDRTNGIICKSRTSRNYSYGGY